MMKCICNDASTNRLCSTKYYHRKEAASALNAALADPSHQNHDEFGVCFTKTFCLAKSFFRNDTLGIIYTCDDDTRPLGFANECNDTTNVYYRVNMRGEKKRMPMPEYCCQLSDVDFCNLNFTSRIRNLDPTRRIANIQLQSSDYSNSQSSNQDGFNVNDYLMVSIMFVAALLILTFVTLCLSKALNIIRYCSFFSKENKFVQINMNVLASECERVKVSLKKELLK
jgi:hypothetical protein